MRAEDAIMAARRGLVYVRVSTDTQSDKGTSLDSQEAACRQYCQQHNIAVTSVYREVFSGAKLWERPELTRVREAVKVRAVDVVVVYALDRLSREQHHHGLLMSELERHGVRLYSVTEDLDNSPQGKLLRSFMAFTAEIEREKIAERTTRGRRTRALKGSPLPGGKRPVYGYDWNDGHTALVINEREAAIVRRIFAEVASGRPMRAIARGLTADGIVAPNEGKWGHLSPQRICKNPYYWGEPAAYRWRIEHCEQIDPRTGTMKSVKRTIERPVEERVALPTSSVPPIVSAELARRAHARMQFNKANLRRPVTTEDALLYGGFVKCGYCHGTMQVDRRDAKRSPVYNCPRRRDYRGGCGYHSISAPVLDAEVWERISRRLKDPELIMRQIEKRQGQNPAASQLATIDARLAELEEERTHTARTIRKIKNEDDAAPLVVELEKIGAEKRKLEAEREPIAERFAIWETRQARSLGLEKRLYDIANRISQATREEQRELLYDLEIRVEVFRADRTPRWTIDGIIRFSDDCDASEVFVSGTEEHCLPARLAASCLPEQSHFRELPQFCRTSK